MCIQYPEIIITSPTEPAVFCAVPETIQENLLTTNYEQWCALYSMNEDDISLEFVSSNLKEQRKQNYEEEEEEYEYGEEYKYEYNEFEDDDDFFDDYQQSLKRQTLSDEFNSYNETHSQKYESYDNNEYDCYYDNESNEYDEGFDYEYDYESDRNYNDVEDDFYMEKKQSKPRLNYGILANAINRRFNKTTDSDFSEEEEIDEFETEAVETKVVIKNVPSFKVTPEIPNGESDLYQEPMDNCSDEEARFDFMEAVSNKFRQKKDSSKVQLKSNVSYEDDFFNEHSFGKLEAISNSHSG